VEVLHAGREMSEATEESPMTPPRCTRSNAPRCYPHLDSGRSLDMIVD